MERISELSFCRLVSVRYDSRLEIKQRAGSGSTDLRDLVSTKFLVEPLSGLYHLVNFVSYVFLKD